MREALIPLSCRGLVEMRQRRGATVTILTTEQVLSMFEVTTELERMAVKPTAIRMTPEPRDMLAEIHRRSEEFVTESDQAGYDTANKKLHELLYRGSGNEYLGSNVKDVRASLHHYRRYPFQKPGRITLSVKDHGAIVSAIVKGDGAAAKNAMENHPTMGGPIFADLVARIIGHCTERPATGAC